LQPQGADLEVVTRVTRPPSFWTLKPIFLTNVISTFYTDICVHSTFWDFTHPPSGLSTLPDNLGDLIQILDQISQSQDFIVKTRG